MKADGGSILALGTRRRLGGALEASWSGPKSSPEDPKRVPGRPKNRKRRSTQHKPPSSYLGAPDLEQKRGQHGSKLVSKIEAKAKQKSMQNSIGKKMMHLGIDVWKYFD